MRLLKSTNNQQIQQPAIFSISIANHKQITLDHNDSDISHRRFKFQTWNSTHVSHSTHSHIIVCLTKKTNVKMINEDRT
ncbi:hypothetical protein HanLR1_Chr03g0077591 [Helianthus annuus]|nr:hypothetical protein HanHA89_Chr03g0084071 [Helianthus annuus]KAJ0766439.1 hypothetical protein HanLR1_Chr03g0077591 [Helianthus annuus]